MPLKDLNKWREEEHIHRYFIIVKMLILPNIDAVQSQSKCNMILVDPWLSLKFVQNKDPEIAKRILKKKEGLKDTMYIVIKP